MTLLGRSSRRGVGIPLSVMEFRWKDTHIGLFFDPFSRCISSVSELLTYVCGYVIVIGSVLDHNWNSLGYFVGFVFHT